MPRGIHWRFQRERRVLDGGYFEEDVRIRTPPPVQGGQPSSPQQQVPDYHSPRESGYGAGSGRGAHPGGKLEAYRKPASLKAIELLLRNPEIALSIKQDLAPLRSAEDKSRKLLLALIELVRNDPNTETFTMLGYCYGTSLGGQLTHLLKSEKITPTEGVEAEFNQILDSILSDIVKKLNLLQLKDELKSRISGTNPSKS